MGISKIWIWRKLRHNPIIMNDETKDQMQLKSYGKEAYETLKGIQRNLDPDGVWETKIDGVKFT